jgi:transcriptional regulator with XRE-family HTH domain
MIAVQCKMARAALGLGVRELAERAKVSPDTVSRLERGEPLRERTVDAIRAALEAAGVDLIAENGGGPGVRLRKIVVAPRVTTASPGESAMQNLRVGDSVKYREDRPGPDPRNVGKVGQIVDPGRPPISANCVFVRFPGEPELEVDRGALLKVNTES